MNYKISNSFLIIGIVSIVTTFILLAFNTFLKADDYCFRVQMANQNSFFVLWDHYIKADGRSLSPIYLFRNLIVKYLSPEFIAIIATSCLIGVGYFIMESVNSFLDIKYKNFSYKLNITLLVSVCLWLGVRANLSRVIYWPIGSFYIYVALAFIGALYYLFNHTNKLRFIILGVLAIFGGINVAFPFLIIYILYGLFIKIEIKIHFGVFVIFIISFLIMFLAPGNFARASRLESGYDFNILTILKNYFKVFIEYLMMSKWILITAVLSAFLFNISKDYEKYKKYKLFKLSLLLVLGALLTIVPFVVLPQAASRHTSIFFQLLLFFGILLFSLYIRSNYFLQNKYLTNSVALLVIIIFLYEGIQQYILSSELKNKINQREMILNKADKSHPVNIAEITSDPRLYSHFYKDYPEEKWTIQCMQSYYKIDTINFIKK